MALTIFFFSNMASSPERPGFLTDVPVLLVALLITVGLLVLNTTRPSLTRLHVRLACTPVDPAAASLAAVQRSARARVQVPSLSARDYGIFRTAYIGAPADVIYVGVLGIWMCWSTSRANLPKETDAELDFLRAAIKETQRRRISKAELEELRLRKRDAERERSNSSQLLRRLEDEQREALLARRDALERRSRGKSQLNDSVTAAADLAREHSALLLHLSTLERNYKCPYDTQAQHAAIDTHKKRKSDAETKISHLHDYLEWLRYEDMAQKRVSHVGTYATPQLYDEQHFSPYNTPEEDEETQILPQHLLPSYILSGTDDDEIPAPTTLAAGAKHDTNIHDNSWSQMSSWNSPSVSPWGWGHDSAATALHSSWHVS